MIISKTPFRVSFFGGGTDYPAWYSENKGAVISTSIDKYAYIICRELPPFFEHKHHIRYNINERTKTIEEIKHPSVRECLKYLRINKGIGLVYDADLPGRAGLGSSSSFTVGLLNALHALKGEKVSKKKLALEAIYVEQELMKENVGSQDQTIAAYGGFNKITFEGDQKITVDPLKISNERLSQLEKNLMLFFTGFSRNSSEIAEEQIKKTRYKTKELNQMLWLVDEAEKILKNNKQDLDEFGKLLNETWNLKKSLSSKISNSTIDVIYEKGMSAGALGGKLLGAGGGGFMLFYAPREKQNNIKEELNDLLHVPFKFESQGSTIIYKMC